MIMTRLVLAFTLVAVSVGPAAGASGVQITRDGKRTLVSRDVGSDRWAITRHMDDHTVTGNVFTGASGAAKFVWSAERGATGDDVRLRCYGADQCDQAPCTSEEWVSIGAVTPPLSFFAAPGS
jgi:hypothetical protein